MKNAKRNTWLLLIVGVTLALANVGCNNNGNNLVIYSVGDLWGTWGFVDKTGKQVVEAKYSYVAPFSEGMAIVGIEDDEYCKYGFVDKTGKVVLELQYDDAGSFSEGMAWVESDGSCGFIDKTGKMVIEPQFDRAESFSEGMAVVCLDGKYGFIDQSGRMIIPQYDEVRGFSEGMAVIGIGGWDDRRYGYIDRSGKMVVEPRFDYADSFSEGMAVVGIKGKYGYIDKSGNRVVEPQFDEACPFWEEMAVIRVGDEDKGKYGFVDKKGKLVIAPQFDDAGSFSEGLAAVEINGKYGYVDKLGKMIITPRFVDARPFSEGLAAAYFPEEESECGRYGYINKTGETVVEPQYDEAGTFRDGLALAVVFGDYYGAWGFIIDTTGKASDTIIIDTYYGTYEFDELFNEGFCLCFAPVKYGLSTSSGNRITEPMYDDMYELMNGMFVYELKGKYGLIDERGRVVASPLYDDVYTFSNDLMMVAIQGKWGLVNKEGKMVVEPQFDEIGNYDEDLDIAKVKKDNKYGFINGKGEAVIELKYDIASDFNEDGEAEVTYEWKRMGIDIYGRVLWEEKMDWYLLEQRQVTYAEDNRLKDTPSELEAIVDGTEVDIRNSIFQILSLLDNNDGCFDAYGYCTLTQEYFNRRNVLYPMKANPAIENVLIRDYNNCLQEVGLEGYHKDVCREKGWGNTWKTRFIDPLLVSERLQNVLYAWVKPELKRTIQRLTTVQKMCLANAINHMIAYTTEYDHQAEKDFYLACCDSYYGEDMFCYTCGITDMEPDRDKEGNPYRLFETWVYRRVEENSMTVMQIHDWLVRIKDDMNLGGLQ